MCAMYVYVCVCGTVYMYPPAATFNIIKNLDVM